MLPSLTLTKEAHPIRYHDVGQVIEYSYTIDNSLFAPIQGPISVKDDKFLNDDGPKVDCPEIEAIGNGDAFLNWNERMICRAFYTITGEDVQNGSVTNTAIASARGINSGSESVTITFDPKYLTLRKTADTLTYSQPGDIVTFTYLVRNGGDVILQGPVTISDDKILNNQVRCQDVQTVGNQDDAFDPDEILTCTAPYAIKEADTHIDPCSVTNTAIASAGGIDSEPASVTIYCKTGLVLTKSADRETYEKPGDMITYTYVIINRGLKPLSGPVTVTDSVGDKQITVSCPNLSTIGNGDGAFDPDEILTCTAPYTITDTDDKNCSVINAAIASAGGINSEPESVTIHSDLPDCGPIRKLSLTKLADRETYDSDDKVIAYTYVVTNGGSDL